MRNESNLNDPATDKFMEETTTHDVRCERSIREDCNKTTCPHYGAHQYVVNCENDCGNNENQEELPVPCIDARTTYEDLEEK